MKNTLRLCGFLVASVCCSLSVPAENLIPNAGCEKGPDSNGLPEGWRKDPGDEQAAFRQYNPPHVRGIVKQVKGIAHSGEHSIGYFSRMSGAAPEPEMLYSYLKWIEMVPLEPSHVIPAMTPMFPVRNKHAYNVSAWTKGVNVSNLLLHVAVYDRDKIAIRAYDYWLNVPNQAGAFKSGQWDWEQWQSVFTININDSHEVGWARIFAWYEEWGRDQEFYLDDVCAEELPDKTRGEERK